MLESGRLSFLLLAASLLVLASALASAPAAPADSPAVRPADRLPALPSDRSAVLPSGRPAVPPADGVTVRGAAKNYILIPEDVVQIKVFQEDNLDTRARLARDGSLTFPLLGIVELAGKTPEQAAQHIRQLLTNGFLVNPQVSVTVVEFAKRRFTVLGQVQRPGTYEMPESGSLNLLQAISMAGGYTRIASPGKVTIQRQDADKKLIFNLDAKAMAKDKNTRVVEVEPDDTITVGESFF